MSKFLSLKKDYDIKLKSRIIEFNSPEYIYLPYNEKEKLISGPEVKKEAKITQNTISPISGKIMGTKYCLTISDGLKQCLVLKNNYKETLAKRTPSLKNPEKLTWEEIITNLEEFDEHNLSQKLKNLLSSTTLILNGIEDEPYIANEIFINKEYPNEILEILDVIREKQNFSKTLIVIKNNDRENIEGYNNLLGTYPQIELVLVPDYYLLGNEKFLQKYLHLKDVFALKPSELKRIYDIVKRKHSITKKIITISGDGIKNPQVIEAKIGSSIKEILNKLIKIMKNEEIEYWANGLMTGRKVLIDNLIVTKDLNALLIMKKETIKEKECMNCGKCVEICPVDCNPKMTYETGQKKYVKNCIDCGLCSYICPSMINLRKYIKGDKNE